jgi:hypothetical protein
VRWQRRDRHREQDAGERGVHAGHKVLDVLASGYNALPPNAGKTFRHDKASPTVKARPSSSSESGITIGDSVLSAP